MSLCRVTAIQSLPVHRISVVIEINFFLSDFRINRLYLNQVLIGHFSNLFF